MYWFPEALGEQRGCFEVRRAFKEGLALKEKRSRVAKLSRAGAGVGIQTPGGGFKQHPCPQGCSTSGGFVFLMPLEKRAIVAVV